MEVELHNSIPYCSRETDMYKLPKWYRLISAYPGGPQSAHSYRTEEHAAIWNTDRMARTKLYTTALQYGLHQIQLLCTFTGPDLNQTCQPLMSQVLSVVEETCASVFYVLSHRDDGLPQVSSFEDVTGAIAYALISPLTVAKECAGLVSDSSVTGRLEWISHVIAVIQANLGVSEAWCWRGDDEAAARTRIEHELSFDDGIDRKRSF